MPAPRPPRPRARRALAAATTLTALLIGPGACGLASAFDHPALDDFYARTRLRSEGLQRCDALCEGDYVLRFILGAQVANPSTDRLQPRLAEGLRLGADTGLTLNAWSLTRTQLWADVLRVQQGGELITDLTLHHTTFYSTAEDRYDEALHLSADVVLASSAELQPDDFADLRLQPYEVVDTELEAALIGPKIDKGGNLALPLGVSLLRRFDLDERPTEDRLGVSAAIALRGFPHLLDTPRDDRGRHYQLDFLRASWVGWATPAGDASALRLTAGYQRLSPGIPGFEIELLAGYGWHDGANAPGGAVLETSVEQELTEALVVGAGYDTWFALDRRTLAFSRVHDARLFTDLDLDGLAFGLSWEYVDTGDAGWLHQVQGRVSWHPRWAYGLGAGVRYRLQLLRDPRRPEPNGAERFNMSLDYLF